MFAKIPQRFAAPFGLLGDEAKLAFPSQPGGITKLTTVRNISENDSYWEQYFVLFDSASDVFSLITPHHIRRALLDAPENVATLIKVVTSRLFKRVSDHTFPASPNPSVAALASSFIRTNDRSDSTKEVLNCIRLLQRVLPIVFEVDGEASAFEKELLWKQDEDPTTVVEDHSQSGSSTPQFVIDSDEEDEDEDDAQPAPKPAPSRPKPKSLLPSLGEKLFGTLIDLMFTCGFTIPTSMQTDPRNKTHYIIWERGIGSTSDPGPSHVYDNNKAEVLRLLLVLLSRQIYLSPTSLLLNASFCSAYFVQKVPRRDVLTILCSLLNTAMNSSYSSNRSIQGMAESVAGRLPYNHLVFKGEDSRSTLVGLCLQVLCVLLDYQSGTARDTPGKSADQSPAPTASTNAFRYFLAKLHRPQDFDFIIHGMVGILEQQMATMNNLLPGAHRSIPYINETIILLWKTLELNKKFRIHTLESERSMDIVAYLLCYALEIKDKPQQHGLCRSISYIVQTLSAEPAFGVKLTKPVRAQLPAKWNSAGTAADFIVNAIYAIVATTSGTLNSLYPALIIALANMAPHVKNLTVVASTRIIQLFKSFSNPLFLLADEGHPRLLFFMLEFFNGVIYNHPRENSNLIYGILSAHQVFEEMGTFTLIRGLREIKRAQLAREDQARLSESTQKDSRTELSDRNAGAEKARLLENESQSSEEVPQASDGASGEQEVLAGSFLTPGVESPTGGSFSASTSEKARGKMRERRSDSMDASLERLAAAGVGRNGFVPTQEWVTSWQQGLPLDTVMLLISELLPRVRDLHATSHKANSTSVIVEFLANVSIKEVLPETPPLAPRRFIWSDASVIWLTSLIWGEIYVRSMTPLGIWNATNVRLFFVKHSAQQTRQITETVTNVVGGLLRRGDSNGPRPTRSS